jgi:oxygen-dependent protoporphyrinogen oxidase
MDQKFAHRVPEGGRLLRGFFGGATADGLLDRSDAEIAALARTELEAVLGIALPEPVVTVVRRWPRALPQYAVGHLERMEELFGRVGGLGGLWLLGNGYRGVGLPDLVRDARAAVSEAVGQDYFARGFAGFGR